MRALTPWNKHVKKTHANLKATNPDQKFKDTLVAAAKTWKKTKKMGGEHDGEESDSDSDDMTMESPKPEVAKVVGGEISPSEYPGVYGKSTGGSKKGKSKKNKKTLKKTLKKRK
jgi:hypothetical protein